MGRQARLRALRRAQAQEAVHCGPIHSKALRTLEGIFHDIRCMCLKSQIECWQLLVEMMAHAAGWQTDSQEDEDLWSLVPMAQERLEQYHLEWNEEVLAARELDKAFSDPLGEIHNQIVGPRDNSFQISMEEVRHRNRIHLQKIESEHPDPLGLTPRMGLDPLCGTGRWVMDTLVFNDSIIMHAVEIDKWLYRAMLVNIRYLAIHSSIRVSDRKETRLFERDSDNFQAQESDDRSLLVIGGRVLGIHAHPGIVDLEYVPNWFVAPWFWEPRPSWEHTMLIDEARYSFRGTWAEYLDHVRDREARRLEPPARQGVRYDFQMSDQRRHPER
jgi:hypothetical protein